MKLFYGNSIKIYRKQQHLYQEELANRLKISKSMLGMLENNNRNASEKIETIIKKKIGISLDKEKQELLLENFGKFLTESLVEKIENSHNGWEKRDLNRSLKNLPEISKIYYEKLGESDFIEINEVIDNLSVLLPLIYKLSFDYYKKENELKLFYNTYTAFLLDNAENIIEIINNYLSKDEKSIKITVFRDKIPLNIRKDFAKVIKSINSTTYADYNTYTLNTYSSEKQIGFVINNDSMIPKYEKENIVIVNILISNAIENLENNKDYLIRINKEFFVRRIQIEDKQIILKTLNNNYDVKVIPVDDILNGNVEIIGKITDIKIN